MFYPSERRAAELLQERPDAQKVMRFLGVKRAATAFEIAPAVQIHPDRAREILLQLEDNGLAERGPASGIGPVSGVYSLTPLGLRILGRLGPANPALWEGPPGKFA